jgi:hypothetical protein
MNYLDRQAGPTWELRDEQPANELGVDVDLVRMHLLAGHVVLGVALPKEHRL